MAGLSSEIVIRSTEYRPCIVYDKKALFHKWEDSACIVPPALSRGGHNGGTLRRTLAIVEFETGKVERVMPEDVRFLDTGNKMREIMFDFHTRSEKPDGA